MQDEEGQGAGRWKKAMSRSDHHVYGIIKRVRKPAVEREGQLKRGGEGRRTG